MARYAGGRVSRYLIYGLGKLLMFTFKIEFQYFFADKMINDKKISQQNKINWFVSFYSLYFELNDSFLNFGPEK